MIRGGGWSAGPWAPGRPAAGRRTLIRSPPARQARSRRRAGPPGNSNGRSAGRSRGSATATPPFSAGSQSQRVRVIAASPRPSATTSAQHARSRPCPSPSPVHRWVTTRSRTCAPGQSPATSRTPRPRRSVASRRCLTWAGACAGGRSRTISHPSSSDADHLRPGRTGLRDQQGPPGVQAEARGGEYPGLGYPRDPAPRPVRRSGGHERQAQQAELRHGQHRSAGQPAPRQ